MCIVYVHGCMCVCMVRIQVCMCVCMCTCVTRSHELADFGHVYLRQGLYVSYICVYIRAHVCACMCVNVCALVCARSSECIYVHAYTSLTIFHKSGNGGVFLKDK